MRYTDVCFFSVSGVCTTLYDTRYVLCTRCVWYQVRTVSLFVYSLVGGGTHDTYVPPKKQLYRLFVSGWWYHTNVPPVDAHVWRQLHLSAIARCSDSYCIFNSKYVGWTVKFWPVKAPLELLYYFHCGGLPCRLRPVKRARVPSTDTLGQQLCARCWKTSTTYIYQVYY